MTEAKRPLKVFLCHAHADRDPVRGLYTRLTKDGVDAWLDKEKLLPGQDWEYEIRKAVREADVVVVCLSKEFNQAGFRQKEVRIALDAAMHQPDGEIFIIPARLEECDNLESLRKWHWVDLFEEDGYERLTRALKTRADKIGVTLRIRKSRASKEKREKDVKKSDQEKRVFYDLTVHYECDFENTTVVTSVNFLFETLTRIMRTVAGVDKNDNTRRADYQTGQVKYLDPKDGKTIQHALIVQGRKIQSVSKSDDQVIEPLKLISEMLIITITQSVNGSLVRFDSNELPNDAFKNLVEWILADLGKTVTVQIQGDGSTRESLSEHQQPKNQIPKNESDPASGALNAGGAITSGVIVTGSNNVINVGKQETTSSETPKDGKPESNKAKTRQRPNTAVIVAIIGLVGTIIAALLSSPLIANWFSPPPVPTATTTFTPTASETLDNQETWIATAVVLVTQTLSPALITTEVYTPTVTPTALPTEIADAKGVSMMLVPAGEFTMGNDNGSDDEKPAHKVFLDNFYMDKYEVTNALFKACVTDGSCLMPITFASYTRTSYYNNMEFNDYPVIYVDWNRAKNYCEWRGARLPTEAEWEKAARGGDGRIYPWGENADCNHVNFFDGNKYCVGDTSQVGTYASGKSFYGIYDMAGNVWEWVMDRYDANYYLISLYDNPKGPQVGTYPYRVLRGGSWFNYEIEVINSANRHWLHPDSQKFDIGFRCAKDVP